MNEEIIKKPERIGDLIRKKYHYKIIMPIVLGKSKEVVVLDEVDEICL